MSLLGTRERLGRAAASFNFLVGVAGLLALTLPLRPLGIDSAAAPPAVAPAWRVPEPYRRGVAALFDGEAPA